MAAPSGTARTIRREAGRRRRNGRERIQGGALSRHRGGRAPAPVSATSTCAGTKQPEKGNRTPPTTSDRAEQVALWPRRQITAVATTPSSGVSWRVRQRIGTAMREPPRWVILIKSRRIGGLHAQQLAARRIKLPIFFVNGSLASPCDDQRPAGALTRHDQPPIRGSR